MLIEFKIDSSEKVIMHHEIVALITAYKRTYPDADTEEFQQCSITEFWYMNCPDIFINDESPSTQSKQKACIVKKSGNFFLLVEYTDIKNQRTHTRLPITRISFTTTFPSLGQRLNPSEGVQ